MSSMLRPELREAILEACTKQWEDGVEIAEAMFRFIERAPHSPNWFPSTGEYVKVFADSFFTCPKCSGHRYTADRHQTDKSIRTRYHCNGCSFSWAKINHKKYLRLSGDFRVLDTNELFPSGSTFFPVQPAPQHLPPIPMILNCPHCGTRHIDEGEFATKPHTSHTCQNAKCGLTWKAAHVPTVGVQFLPGTQNK